MEWILQHERIINITGSIIGILVFIIGVASFLNKVNPFKLFLQKFRKLVYLIIGPDERIELEMNRNKANIYFHLALSFLHVDRSSHYFELANYYNIFFDYDIEINDYDLEYLKHQNGFIKKYEKDDITLDPSTKSFLVAFKDFMEICKKRNKIEHLVEVNKIWKSLCRKFNESEIEDAVKKFSEKIDL